MSMKITDTIHGPARGTAEMALSNIDRPEKIDLDYVTEVYRYAPIVEIDPAIVVSQWHLETAGGTSVRWRVNGNPAGLGIAADGDPDPAKWNGTEAARVHIWALLVACGSWLQANRIDIPVSAIPFRDRWVAKYSDPNCPTVSTIDDLNIRYLDSHGEPQATWAWDLEYQDKIVQRSRVLFGDTLPDQEGPPVTEYRTSIPGLPGGPLVTEYPVKIMLMAVDGYQRTGRKANTPRRSVQHGTGNANNPSAVAEAQYFIRGAEGRQASIHYCTDDTQAVVVVPLDEVTWQAADGAGPGNLNGFSCEMMEANVIWSNPSRRDALIALTADLMGRTAARLGATKPEQHYTFNAGQPASQRHDCPSKLRHTTIAGQPAWDIYAGIWQAARVDELRRMGGTATTTAAPVAYPPSRIEAPDQMSAQGHPLEANDPRRFKAIQGGRFRTAPADDAPPATPTPYRAGRTYTFDYRATVDGEAWLVSKAGSWAHAKNFEQAA